MGGPARLWALLAFAAAAQVAAATDRYVPRAADFLVADVGRNAPDAALRGLVSAWRSAPDSDATAVALTEAFIARARALREPGYMGRAEAVIARRATAPGASADTRRLYAETLQYRHDFARAETLLDALLHEQPGDPSARALRASIRLVRGNFPGARADCAALMSSGAGGQVGAACLAEALAGAGGLDRGRSLLDAYAPRAAATPGDAYLLTVRGELRERAGDSGGAIDDYRAALAAAPRDDSIRASLADALAATGDPAAALGVLDVERPGIALLVRLAACSTGTQRAAFASRAADWLALEVSRGDALHNREAAMLALTEGDARTALTAARANFRLQRELPDVRVYARAAIAARDEAAQRELRDWLREAGFRDVLTETILAGAARSKVST
jgi:thioredoxin-like negative regulator of GroEL